MTNLLGLIVPILVHQKLNKKIDDSATKQAPALTFTADTSCTVTSVDKGNGVYEVAVTASATSGVKFKVSHLAGVVVAPRVVPVGSAPVVSFSATPDTTSATFTLGTTVASTVYTYIVSVS